MRWKRLERREQIGEHVILLTQKFVEAHKNLVTPMRISQGMDAEIERVQLVLRPAPDQVSGVASRPGVAATVCGDTLALHGPRWPEGDRQWACMAGLSARACSRQDCGGTYPSRQCSVLRHQQ